MRDCDPIVKVRKARRHFPMEGARRSQVYMNDPCAPENRRRLRCNVDPLRDGYDPGEDPCRPARVRRQDSRIPIR